MATYQLAAPSVPPENIQAEAVSPTSLAITWDPLPPEARNGIIRHYSILITAEQPWVDYTRELVENGTTGLIVMGLTPFVTYEIQINAHTIFPGPFSSNYTVTTLEAGRARQFGGIIYVECMDTVSLQRFNVIISVELVPLNLYCVDRGCRSYPCTLQLYQVGLNYIGYSVLATCTPILSFACRC